MFNAKLVHCGQYKSYGDFFRVWNVQTGANETDTLEYCFSELYKHRIPDEIEWRKMIRCGANADYYFSGYYKLEKNDSGYWFTVCEPYTD